MKNTLLIAVMSSVCAAASAECVISEDVKKLDPIEVGYCESDAIFVGKVEQKIETSRAYTDAESGQTKHFATQRSTIRIVNTLKGEPGEKVTMLSQLYDKDRAFEFENLKSYVVFAKKLSVEGEYAGASAKCSVQPTVIADKAKNIIKQLERIKSGARKVDCSAIRAK